MILIQRYIFKELVYNFIFSFVVISVVVLLASLVGVLFRPEVSLDMVFSAIPVMLLGIMRVVFPAGALVSVVTTYGRMAGDNELIAITASGIHFFRVVVPAILFGLLVSMVLLVANDRYVPAALKKAKTLLREQDLHQILDNVVKRGVKSRAFGDWSFSWDSCERLEESDGPGAEGEHVVRPGNQAWVFRGFLAIQFDEDRKVERKLHADRAIVEAPRHGMKSIVFQLYRAREFGGSSGISVQAGKVTLPPLSPGGDIFRVRLSHRGFAALLAILGKNPHVFDEARTLTEIHSRIAQSLSPLVLIFLGISVAVIFRHRNRMVAFFVAVLLAVFIYYPVILLGQSFAKGGAVHPAICIWPGNVIMFFGGLFLLVTVAKR